MADYIKASLYGKKIQIVEDGDDRYYGIVDGEKVTLAENDILSVFEETIGIVMEEKRDGRS